MPTNLTKISTNGSVGLLILRLAFGFRLIYGVQDNIFSWAHMIEFEKFLEANSFPFPLVSAVASVYLQAIAGLLWVVGYQTRYASLVMMANFSIALVGVHFTNGDGYLQMAPAIHLLTVSLLLFLIGPGKFSIDFKIKPPQK